MFIYRCKYCSNKLNNKEISKSGWLNIHMKFSCKSCGAKYHESGLVKFIMATYIFLPVFMSKFLIECFGKYYGILIGIIWISFASFLTTKLIIITSKVYESE